MHRNCPNLLQSLNPKPSNPQAFGKQLQSLQALAKQSGDRRFAFDSYRRFVQMYSGAQMLNDTVWTFRALLLVLSFDNKYVVSVAVCDSVLLHRRATRRGSRVKRKGIQDFTVTVIVSSYTYDSSSLRLLLLLLQLLLLLLAPVLLLVYLKPPFCCFHVSTGP